MPGARQRMNLLLSGGVRPSAGFVVGLAGVAVIGAAFAVVHEESARVIEALILVVPVIGAAVVGGRRAAYGVAVVAAFAFTLIVPPLGRPQIELTQDIVALVVFLIVALVVGGVVARRVETLGHLEQQRELLLRSVSHDFRTPLSIISAATSDLMQSPDYDETTRQRMQSLVLEEAARLDRLVANLLNLSRMRSDGLTPSLQSVDLAELVTHSTDRMRRVMRDLDLTTDVPAGLPLIQGDFTQLDQVLTNLIENAARHSPPDGVVRLTVEQHPRTVRITVADDGPGVPPAEAELIFEPFRSGALPGSSGVGLAICRGIVNGHGGTISVGAAPSGGAELIVDLPL